MKFYNYLNEKMQNQEQFIENVLSDCQSFLKDWKTIYRTEFLWSGRQKKLDFARKQIRKNRTPKDTPIELHYEMDDWFNKKFGVKARSNALFCTFDGSHSASFGKPHIIFPIGKYKLISSNLIKDVYNILEELFEDFIGTHVFYWSRIKEDGLEDEFIDKLFNELEKGNYKINQHNNNEQMLICKEYYLCYADNFQTMKLIELKNELLHRKV